MNVASYAAEFGRRARNGERPVAHVAAAHVETFLGSLAREGLEFARECLKNISDPALRRIVEAIFFSAVAGAAIGALIGGHIGGPPGAQVGAMVGVGIGLVVGCTAVIISAFQEEGPAGPELVFSIR